MTTTTPKNWQTVLDEARRDRAAAAERKAAAEAERAAAEAAELERKRDAFLTWLGPLADALEVSPARFDVDRVRFNVHPAHWKVSDLIGVYTDRADDAGWYKFQTPYRDTFSQFYSAADASFAQFLLDWEERYERVLARTIAEQRDSLVKVDDPGCADNDARINAALWELMRLAPERTAEWRELRAASREALDALWAEEAEKAAVRAAAVERYREAMEAWADECAAVRAANAATVTAIQARENLPLMVRDIEYANMGDDGWVETRTVTALDGDPSGNTWSVLESGEPRVWTFRTITRVSETRVVRPADDPYSDLFAHCATPFSPHPVACIAVRAADVRAELAALPTLPAEPKWGTFGQGLPWGADTGSAAADALNRVGHSDEAPF